MLLTLRIWWAPNNASKWQMGFNSAFKGLIHVKHNFFTVYEATCFDHFKRSSSGLTNRVNRCCVHVGIPICLKVKWYRYRPGVAQRLGRGIALLFHDRGTRRGWAVSSTPRPHFSPGKDPAPILQEAGWAPGPVWTDGKSRPPPRDSIPDRPARSSVAIPTELPGPPQYDYIDKICNWLAIFYVFYQCRQFGIPTCTQHLLTRFARRSDDDRLKRSKHVASYILK